jgi:hypothetical protein
LQSSDLASRLQERLVRGCSCPLSRKVNLQMREHVLPGENGYSDWFDRLNPFERQESLRQVAFKRKHWPDLPDGIWGKNKGETHTYPHILPECRKSLFSGITGKVIESATTAISRFTRSS